MNKTNNLEYIPCPLCLEEHSTNWGNENGFLAVKCQKCGLVYVNPRPNMEHISEAVKSGVHSLETNSINVVTRRIQSKVKQYEKIFSKIYKEDWQKNQPISWLDIGAGFGEIVEAVALIAPKGSNIEGIEPMEPKVEVAQKLGLSVQVGYLNMVTKKYDYVSLINVFSHLPNFHEFLVDVKKVLNKNGEILIETGNAGEFERKYIPGVLSLPDHLVFAGEQNLRGFLTLAGFEIISVHRFRVDGVINFMKNIVKKILNRQIPLTLPYTSPYRSLIIRAKLSANI